MPVRVLINENQDNLSFIVKDQIIIVSESEKIAQVNSGNKLVFSLLDDKIKLLISGKTFISSEFLIEADADGELVQIDERKFRGKLKVSRTGDELKIINELTIEEYVKGVMTREMPVGNGNENYNALKAFSICVRTYAFNKIAQKKSSFDLFSDTRDQVYGGAVSETDYTNKIVDETSGQILFFSEDPAEIFYHSTCGGLTEDVQNVFNSGPLYYLKSIKDGDGPFCKISPRFEWLEQYTESIFINRLYNNGLLTSLEYSLVNVSIKSRFESGRVNELEVRLLNPSGEEKSISLFSNNIRSVIRTSDGRTILRSTMFDVSIDDNKNVRITGRGFGHGVGLCQWGAIGQSKQGIDYRQILNHYFPGTKIKSIND